MIDINLKENVLGKLVSLLVMVMVLNLVLACSSDDDPVVPQPVEPSEPEKITLQCEQPAFLQPGDRVALLSPSYYTPMETIEVVADLFRSWGLEPAIGPNTDKLVDGKLGGTVSERISDISWALNDPSIKAIVCNRGGYGTIQLINGMSLSEIKSCPKWLVGFSDISTLHGLWQRAGVMSIHATTGTFLANDGTNANSTMMRDLLLGKVPQYEVPAHAQNILGTATGVLVGGNLTTIAPNVFSQADATMADDIILFLEEVGEPQRNIDRQFTLLARNGVLSRCKGVILGEFTGSNTELGYESVEALLRHYLQAYHIPVLCGFPAGHGNVNLPLVMGARVTIDVREDGSTVKFNIDGDQTIVKTGDIAMSPISQTQRMVLAGKLW